MHASGCALLPLNWRLSAPEMARVVADAEPSSILAEHRFGSLIDPDSGGRCASFDLDAVTLDEGDQSAPLPIAVNPGDPALILYTSGTSGEARGALIPRRMLLANTRATVDGWALGGDDIALVTSPFFHTAAWNVFALPLWHVGGAIVLPNRFDPGDFTAALADECCTVAFAVPAQYRMAAEAPGWGRPLPDLRFLITGGAPCPPAVDRAVRAAGYPLRNAYGLTECGPNCVVTTDAVAVAHPESVGWPLPSLEMRIMTEAGTESEAGEIGELWLRGPQLFGGYLRAPAATAAAFTADGWLRTGDLASRDASGNHTIRGRLSEMYISGGANIHPGEVERVLLAHPAVVEAAVVGVPDEQWGEAGVAFVVLRPAAEVSGEALREFARGQLAGYKLPREVVRVGGIPQTGSGKADRQALRRMALPADTSPAHPGARGSAG